MTGCLVFLCADTLWNETLLDINAVYLRCTKGFANQRILWFTITLPDVPGRKGRVGS